MKLSGSNKSGRHLIKNAEKNSTAIAKRDPAEVSGIGSTEIAEINPTDIAEMSPGNIAEKSPGNVAEMSPGNVAEMSPGNVAEMSPGNVAAGNSGGLEVTGSDELGFVETQPDPYENAIDIYYEFVDDEDNSDDADEADELGKNEKKSRTRRIIKMAIIGLAILLVTIVTVVALDIWTDSRRFIQPPDVNPVPKPNDTSQPPNTNDPAKPGEATDGIDEPVVDNIRDEEQITILIFGLDEDEWNSDVIMVANLNIAEKTIDVVSIPRDTLVNVEWSIKKANSILANMRLKYSSETDKNKREELAMQATVERFADILGFEVDQWVTVNMRGFVALIDAINGVDFNVPVNMSYHDPYQNLHIEYSRGMHRGLTGRQSLEILRYRSYGSADIGRINTQQLFLTAMIEQVLAKRSSLNIINLADIVISNVRTSIPLDRLIWLGFWFIDLSAEDICFSSMPGNNMDWVNIDSYVTIYLDQWLEMINTKLNPFSEEVTVDDVSILTRGADRKLYVTDGNWKGNSSWGASSRGPNPDSTGGGGTSSGSGSGGSSSGGGGASPGGSSGSGSGGSGSGTGAGAGENSEGGTSTGSGDGDSSGDTEPSDGTDVVPGGEATDEQPGDNPGGDNPGGDFPTGEPADSDRQQPEPPVQPPSDNSNPGG